MTKTRKWLDRLPVGLTTTLVTLAILWLTLAPKPLPDNTLPLIPGIDKIAHACMFGGLTFAIMFDIALRQRKKHIGQHYSKPAYAAIAVAVTAFGAVTELLQAAGTARSGDPADLAADIVGCGVALLVSPAVVRLIMGR